MNQILGVLGAGYVGLAVGVGFAERGHSVVIVESDPERFRQLTQDSFFSSETELIDAFQKVRKEGSLEITDDISRLKGIPLVFMCVGTPQGDRGQSELGQLWNAVEQLCPLLPNKGCIVIKSTVPVGTGDEIQAYVDREESSSSKQIEIISYPEFLREGKSIEDFRSPSRIILGGDPMSQALFTLRAIISSWALPIMVTTRRDAELIKYAANSFLATKISFINQLAQLCEEVGADVPTVARGMGLDPRIGQAFLGAGIGFGGPCLPKDVHSLIAQGQTWNVKMPLLEAVLEINDHQREWVIGKVNRLSKQMSIKRLAVWGCSFKGGSEDIRDSAALPVMEALLDEGYILHIHDPFALERLQQHWVKQGRHPVHGQQISWHENRWDATKEADALIILTDWQEFREGPIADLKQCLTHPLVIDGRNLFPPSLMEEAGLSYISVGRKVRT